MQESDFLSTKPLCEHCDFCPWGASNRTLSPMVSSWMRPFVSHGAIEMINSWYRPSKAQTTSVRHLNVCSVRNLKKIPCVDFDEPVGHLVCSRKLAHACRRKKNTLVLVCPWGWNDVHEICEREISEQKENRQEVRIRLQKSDSESGSHLQIFWWFPNPMLAWKDREGT